MLWVCFSQEGLIIFWKNTTEHFSVCFYLLIIKSQVKWKWLELINCHARCNSWWHEARNQAICILKHALVLPVSACLRGCEWNAHQIQSITLNWANSDVISICVLNPTTHQCEAQNPQNNQNIRFIQTMPQWRPTAAQLLNRFLRRWNVLSTAGAADIYTSATPSTSPCCAQIQQPPSAFGRGYSGCTPPGRSSTQVNLFVEPGKTPVNHLYSLVVFLWVLDSLFYRIRHFPRH